ncbi:MAG: hypothetical protein KJZ69_09350 [Phycisphaerales bacterium]|nr:hypothetical protein [Phycisphaerales bacterium]
MLESNGAAVFGEDDLSHLHDLLDLYRHTQGAESLALAVTPTTALTTTQIVLARRDVLRSESIGRNLESEAHSTSDPTFAAIGRCNRVLEELSAELCAIGPVGEAMPTEGPTNTAEPDPLDAAIRGLAECVKRHRLLFLFSAECARHNPTAVSGRTGVRERVSKEDVWGWKQMLENVDSDGNFLFEYAWVIEGFAQEAISMFGPGKGCKPKAMTRDGSTFDVEGSTYPFWTVDTLVVHELECSSERLLEACRNVAAVDTDNRFCTLVDMTIERARPQGHPRWYSSVIVRWEYLELLDTLLAEAERACVECNRKRGAQATRDDLSGSPFPNVQMAKEQQQLASLCLLMLLAQAYYKMLECTVSMAGWCTALDLELNQSYLWVTDTLTKLLKNDSDLKKDFPEQFEPLFPDLYPSTIRDHEWEDMVGPEAERFLSTVQRYALEHGIRDPDKGSAAWTLVEWVRPSIDNAIKQAENYERSMRAHIRALLAKPKDSGAPTDSGGSLEPVDASAQRTGDLASLLDDANCCLTLLADFRRDFAARTTASSVSIADAESCDFLDPHAEAEYRAASDRIESNLPELTDCLTRVLAWGRQQGLEVCENLGFLTDTSCTDGVRAEICGSLEVDVRTVQSRLLLNHIATGSTGTRSERIDAQHRWLKVSEVARITGLNTGEISRLCDEWVASGGRTGLANNGKTKRERRIDPSAIPALELEIQRTRQVKIVKKAKY